ncbi:MAG: DUF6516 family protein [Rhodospirillales bacterium]|nr:DUF6516 family protein [Rhodospirillales bacterium]
MPVMLIMRERTDLGDAFVELLIWQLPRRLPGSDHRYKYRMALVKQGVCVVRYDNEAGKGDHRHVGEREEPYEFVDVDTLIRDFVEAVKEHLR